MSRCAAKKLSEKGGWSCHRGRIGRYRYQHKLRGRLFRPPYPPLVFDVLAGLLPPQPRRILDAGCGTGALARHLPRFGLPIDAVDISAAMVRRGQRLPGGAHPLIHWSIDPIERVPLHPPYSLVVTGDSLHWMDWHVVLPRFANLLQPHGRLAVLELDHAALPWSDDLRRVIQRYSTNRAYQALDLVTELTRRKLFVEEGRANTPPWPFRQSVQAYVESFHGRASFSRERMRPADAVAFDRAVRALVTQFTHEEVELPLVTRIVWGTPVARS